MPPRAQSDPGSAPLAESRLVRQLQHGEAFGPLFGTVTQATAGFV